MRVICVPRFVLHDSSFVVCATSSQEEDFGLRSRVIHPIQQEELGKSGGQLSRRNTVGRIGCHTNDYSDCSTARFYVVSSDMRVLEEVK